MFGPFHQMQIASFSVQLCSFPQKTPYFHKKIALNPPCFQGNQEYLSIQRRSNSPEGESRQEPRRTGSGARKSAGKGTPRRTRSGTRKGTGEGTLDENRERGSEEDRQRKSEEHRRRDPQGDRRGSPQGNPKRDSRCTQETGCRGWNKKALTANGMSGYEKRELSS
jgi:hypothetical protein